MRKLFIIAIGVALLALPLAVNANIDGGDHDLVDGTGTAGTGASVLAAGTTLTDVIPADNLCTDNTGTPTDLWVDLDTDDVYTSTADTLVDANGSVSILIGTTALSPLLFWGKVRATSTGLSSTLGRK